MIEQRLPQFETTQSPTCCKRHHVVERHALLVKAKSEHHSSKADKTGNTLARGQEDKRRAHNLQWRIESAGQATLR